MIFSQNRNLLKTKFQVEDARGFTLLEISLVIGLFALLSMFVFASLSQFRAQSALDTGAEQVFTVMKEARANTLAAKDAQSYGVYLDEENTRLVLFSGKTYDPSDATNKIYNLDKLLTFNHITLPGDENVVVFERLTGASEDHGTFVLELKDGGFQQVRFEVQKTGNIMQI